ncbi:hypothetical protein [Desemzia sp. FAM 23990]|uniref:hypothetical protein n=1 Tax=Desemzia sp. FAM 23990 TaxID=3259520 RepID=UPI0038876C09
MQSKMIYSAPYEAAKFIMYPREVVIRYKSEPLNGISYKYATEKETLDVYEVCMDLMEYLEKKLEFEDIETTFKAKLKLKLES